MSPEHSEPTRQAFPELRDPHVRQAVDAYRAGVEPLPGTPETALRAAQGFIALERAAKLATERPRPAVAPVGPLLALLAEIENRLLRASICGTREARQLYLIEASDMALGLSTDCLKSAESCHD